MKYICCCIMLLTIFGCGGKNDDAVTPAVVGSKGGAAILYEINTDPRLNYGTIKSSDNDTIYLNYIVNNWSITVKGGTETEISLKTKQEINYTEYDPSALWAFFIRTNEIPVGVISADKLEAKLIFNYSQNDEICCVNTLPYSAFDIGDKSYLAESGFIDFESDRKATFNLNFRQEIEMGSGEVTGRLVNVVGCWNIGGEGAPSGCGI